MDDPTSSAARSNLIQLATQPGDLLLRFVGNVVRRIDQLAIQYDSVNAARLFRTDRYAMWRLSRVGEVNTLTCRPRAVRQPTGELFHIRQWIRDGG